MRTLSRDFLTIRGSRSGAQPTSADLGNNACRVPTNDLGSDNTREHRFRRDLQDDKNRRNWDVVVRNNPAVVGMASLDHLVGMAMEIAENPDNRGSQDNLRDSRDSRDSHL